MKQASLIVIPRRPSLTAAVTRARRDKARAWAKARGLPTYEPGTQSCVDQDMRGPRKEVQRHECGGVIMPHPAFTEPRPVCWECVPYDDAPVRNFEHWCGPGVSTFKAPCVRCEKTRKGGGIGKRGGPFCWDCGTPDDAAMEAWLIRLRTEPDTAPPWKGDKVVRHG